MTSAAAATALQPGLEPDLHRARELAQGHNVVPVRYRFIDDVETPVSAFLKLRGEGPSFLLESAEQGRLGRWSFLGFRPRAILRWSDGVLAEWDEGSPSGSDPDRTSDVPDPYGAVAGYLARYSIAEPDALPPFAGGAVGFFGYDLVRTVETRLGPPPNPDPVGLPDMALMISDVLVAFDHQRHEVTLIVNAFVEDGGIEAAYDRAAATIAWIRDRLKEPVPTPASPAGPRGAPASPAEPPGASASFAEPPRASASPRPASQPHIPAGEAEEMGIDGEAVDHRPRIDWRSNVTRGEFEATVAKIVEYVHAGDAFQVVPSQRFSADSPVEAFSIYRGLRVVNPSPYMYFLDFGDFEIAGASPEPLVKVTGDRVETRPIAGTYPRSGDDEEDRRRAELLLQDPKERAEHVMLVDLGRNDLGRVSEYGTVNVDELMIVETYSHVLHIVSHVSGRLRAELGPMDVLRATLPAGTLSGAPKVRAMEIIDELEPHKRGSYGGAIGYLSYTGDLDTAIHIRTVVVKDGRAYVQAGGGTVADARPEYEYVESVNKARAVFRAIELAAEQPEWP
ncbi:MAG TPA: chorismate-binding protein [Solirubrobacterales bacterium]|jgi:anthranilate synthase component 1|nr:chorismate-binding protein [Solirubrobacterales bacterium]